MSTFKSLMDQESLSNDEVLNRLNELNRELRDDQMAAVERFASSDEVGNAAFPLAHILVERGRMDAAANVIVGALLPDPKNREYGMWKWWEYSFRARPDYEQLSRRMIESLIGEFAKGSPERKLVVAELFGKGPAEAQLSTEQFRQVLARDSEPVSQP